MSDYLDFDKLAENASSWEWAFYDKIRKRNIFASFNFTKCYQCGKCVGICPAAQHSNFNPRLIIRDVLFGELHRVLDSEDIWLCFDCFDCKVRCPMNLDIPELIHALRVEALLQGRYPKRFKTFLEFGRNMLETGSAISLTGRVKKVRKRLGMTERPISEQAVEELKVIAEETGLNKHLDFLECLIEGKKEEEKKG